jgi:hypothetical protein
MTGEEIAMQARDACKSFQAKCSKFAGAVTAELMKKHLGNCVDIVDLDAWIERKKKAA